jgi:transcriptional regulator with XRE-family HTH domain
MSETAVKSDHEVLAGMRRALGLRLHQVSKEIGVDVSQISRFEAGKAPLSEEKLNAYGDFLGQMAQQRSEAQILPPDPTVGISAREIGQSVRERRLAWGIGQNALAAAALIKPDTLSLAERGYVELDAEVWRRLNDVLNSMVRQKDAMLRWWEDPGRLEKRREQVGVSRRRLARHLGQTEEWLVDVEGGRIPLSPDDAAACFSYLGAVESSKGVVPLKSMLHAPLPTPSNNPQDLAKENRRLAELNALLRKSLKMAEKAHDKGEEAIALLEAVVEEIEEKLGKMQNIVAELPECKGRNKLIELVQNAIDVINQ